MEGAEDTVCRGVEGVLAHLTLRWEGKRVKNCSVEPPRGDHREDRAQETIGAVLCGLMVGGVWSSARWPPRQQIGLPNLPIGPPNLHSVICCFRELSSNWYLCSLLNNGCHLMFVLHYDALTLFPKITLFCLSWKKSPLHSWRWHDRNSSRSSLGSISVQGSLNVPSVQFAWLSLAAAVKCYFIHNEHYKYKYKTSVS